MNKKLRTPMIGTALSTLILCFTAVEGTGRTVLDPRNISLTNSLDTCPTRESVGGDVRVGFTIGGNLVFDIRSMKGDSRLIDALHLLLQFGYKIKDLSFTELIICGGGDEVYRLKKSDLDELAKQYYLDARIWAFHNWPERLKKPDGHEAFSSWSGGFLGVMSKQTSDLNAALKAWLQKAKSD